MKQYWADFVIVLTALLRGYPVNSAVALLAQARLETGNYTSTYWFHDKNLFGMSEMRNQARRKRLVGVRLGPDGLYRAQFGTLFASVNDRIDWDEQQGVLPGSDYVASFSAKYHPSDTYAHSVNSLITPNLYQRYWLMIAIMPVTLLIVLKCYKMF